MNNTVEDFQSKIRKYHSLPEAIVIDNKVIGYPFYVVILDLTYLCDRELDFCEEFILKCIKLNLNTTEQIYNFLGVDIEFVEKKLSHLISNKLIHREDFFKLTKIGKDTLNKQIIQSPVSESRTYYIDALSSKIQDYFKFQDVKYSNDLCLNKIIYRPKKDKPEDIFVNYSDEIEKLICTSDNQKKVELIQVNKIEKLYVRWQKLNLVIYKHRPEDNEILYEIFWGNSIRTDYKNTIESLHYKGIEVLKNVITDDYQDIKVNSESEIFKNITIDNARRFEKLNTELNTIESESESLNVINFKKEEIENEIQAIRSKTKISEIIHTVEHRNYLLKALKEAKERIMIISPWIRRYVVDNEFLSDLEKALKRKVKVHIYYGIKGSSQQNDTWVINKLNKLAKIYNNFIFERVKNTHRKIIVCDCKFGIVTSFNFLSFRADPNFTYRDELGVVLRDQQTIEELFNDGLALK